MDGSLRNFSLSADDFHCTQCGSSMNPVEVMLGPVCGKCCRRNHEAVTGHQIRKPRKKVRR